MENRHPLHEEQLTKLLEIFQPAPTKRFYTRMAKAPWQTRPALNIYTMQAAVLIGAVLGVLLFTPSTNPLMDATNTPTASSTSETANAAGLPLSLVGTQPPPQTPQPESTPTPFG